MADFLSTLGDFAGGLLGAATGHTALQDLQRQREMQDQLFQRKLNEQPNFDLNDTVAKTLIQQDIARGIPPEQAYLNAYDKINSSKSQFNPVTQTFTPYTPLSGLSQQQPIAQPPFQQLRDRQVPQGSFDTQSGLQNLPVPAVVNNSIASTEPVRGYNSPEMQQQALQANQVRVDALPPVLPVQKDEPSAIIATEETQDPRLVKLSQAEDYWSSRRGIDRNDVINDKLSAISKEKENVQKQIDRKQALVDKLQNPRSAEEMNALEIPGLRLIGNAKPNEAAVNKARDQKSAMDNLLQTLTNWENMYSKYGTTINPLNKDYIKVNKERSDLINQYRVLVNTGVLNPMDVPYVENLFDTIDTTKLKNKFLLNENDFKQNFSNLKQDAIIKFGNNLRSLGYEIPNKDQAIQNLRQSPDIGAVESGYRFKGGDPADQNSWEKLQ